MTREEAVATLTGARDLLYQSRQDGASPWCVGEVVGRMTAALAALAQPPGPAPSMEEVERLMVAVENAALGLAMISLPPGCSDAEYYEAHKSLLGARSALLAAIRALPDRYVETAAAAAELFRELDRHCPEWRRDTLAEGGDDVNAAWRRLARSLPTPNPEDRR